jgi:non-heme Fe2+,alpha-ketoglutarate-dependent halogenase
VRLDSDENVFYNRRYKFEFEPAAADIVPMELQPGEFVIFSERVVHGSGPNLSSDRRMGFNFRVITPQTHAYPEGVEEGYRSVHMGESYSLDNWGAVQIRGSDTAGLNPILERGSR